MIADEINQILSQVPLANLAVDIGEEAESPDEGDAQDQEEEIIQVRSEITSFFLLMIFHC